MQDTLQAAKDGIWLSLVKHFGLEGTPSESDDSTLPVEFRQKAQPLLPEIKSAWIIDEGYTLPRIQALPGTIDMLVSALEDPGFNDYAVSELRTLLPPLVPGIQAIKAGDSFESTANVLDPINYTITDKMFASQSMFDEFGKTTEGQALLEKLRPGSESYRAAWDSVNGCFAGYFFVQLRKKVGTEDGEQQ